MTASDWLEQPCNKSANINKMVASCYQLVSNFLTTWTSSANTICWRLVGRLATRCEICACVLLPSCCEKTGTSCYHLVTRLMTVTDFWQIVPTRLIQTARNKLLRACCHQLVTYRRYQTCWNNLLRVCWPHQPCYKMIITCSRLVNNWEQAMRTHLVDRL
jgi:hypothetical protein